MISPIRIRALNDAPKGQDGEYVLYWMTSARRLRSNPALEYAVQEAKALGLPLVLFEALRVDYPYASDRFHGFVIDGMREHRAALAKSAVTYYPYVEPKPKAAAGLLVALAERAALVVGDDWPCSFHPAMQKAAAAKLRVRFEVVDAATILPYRTGPKAFARAVDFRRHVQKNLLGALSAPPAKEPLKGFKGKSLTALPADILSRWPMATDAMLAASKDALKSLPIDHGVSRTDEVGGSAAAHRALDRFVRERLDRYADDRNDPDAEVASGLSPWLHFGHIGPFEIFDAVTAREGFSPLSLPPSGRGQREGFFGLSAAAEAFLDQLLTWRELGINGCAFINKPLDFKSLPAWALKTLNEHRSDPRVPVYRYEAFATASTHDPIWNAAQRELLTTGRMQNYLRMLWGKKILHWSKSPEEALATMLDLNDRYALDGRDPNSYTGIFWVLGRYDRAWGPERPIFGKIRYMASENTAKKLKLKGYLARFSGD